MTSRERVHAALNHRESDKVPICFGGTPATTIEECPPDHRAATNLYRYIGLEDAAPVRLAPVCNVVTNIDERCMQRLHSDIRLVTDNPPPPVAIEETDFFVCGALSSGHFPLNGYGLLSGMDKWLGDMKIRPRFYHRLCERFMEHSAHAIGMEPRELKRRFGTAISFLGGLDIQGLLPFGDPEAIRDGVRLLIGECAPGGGYVFSASYVIQCNTPPENIVAMFDAADEYGTYPLRHDDEAMSYVDFLRTTKFRFA